MRPPDACSEDAPLCRCGGDARPLAVTERYTRVTNNLAEDGPPSRVITGSRSARTLLRPVGARGWDRLNRKRNALARLARSR